MAGKAYFETLEAARLLRDLQGTSRVPPADRVNLEPVLEGIHRPKNRETVLLLQEEPPQVEIPSAAQTGQLSVPDAVPQPVISGSFETVADFFQRLIRRQK
ncbi:MAG: hypothetical protein K1Y36_12480 [Blastocatellia bacterium]|nr:hypothetical protein [Blastocatellia bacterium]